LYIDQGSTPGEYTTNFAYDTYGNMTSLTNTEGHNTTFAYSAEYQHAYLTSKTNMVDGQEITMSSTYDFNTGYITSRTCACGSVTHYEYDLFGRLTKVVYPLVLGEQASAEYEIIYDDVNNMVTLYNENDEKTVKYYDGLGRMIKTEVYKDTLWAQWLYEYNYLGKPKQITDPLSRIHKYGYDSLGRVTAFVNPDQTCRTIEYDDIDNTIIMKDENQHEKVYTFSWTGSLLSVEEYNGTSSYLTEYEYDLVGNLTKMVDPEQNVTSYFYDSIFGITAVIYPDSTEQHFIYDNIGNVIEKIDQNDNHIVYTYDSISRLKHANYQDTSVSFVYDPAGYRTSMITPDVTTYYNYDARNRLTQVISIIDGKSYSIGYTYDPASNITEMTYPDGTTIQYAYFLENQVESIQGFASFNYLPDGNLDEILLFNGVTTDFGYDSRGRLQNIHASTDSDLLNLTYSYDLAGNITQVENNFLTAASEWITSTELYSYDDLNRLVSASNGFGTLSYTYDSKKRLSVTENGQSTSYVYEYDLLVAADPQTFTYDSNGNMLTKSSQFEWAYYYNKANKLIQMNKDGQPFGDYVYDGDGKRIKKTEWSEDLQEFVTTVYVYSGLDVVYEESTFGTALHIYGPSGRIAKRTTINDETSTFYYMNDHLRSTRMITDENGTPLTSVKYYPFGKSYQYSGSEESYLFTGKERDLTGLYYFGARYYDPETGRFLARDPYTFLPDDPRTGASTEERAQWLMNPQRFDRFSYAGNNPLKYKDPTGLSFECFDPECQDLLDEGGEDPPPEDTPPENPSPSDDDDEDSSRQEDCEDCDCMERADIKSLRWLKKKVRLGEIGVAAAYGIFCGIAAGFACLETGPAAALCAIIGGLACSLVFGFLYDASMEDVINDIHWAMDELGCSCAIYCEGWW
ncbi:MAG: RHS repeat protein, partial [Theionarchaea archaeon]|nr:RHS repeat protein [Theionarchaea archaeon]